MLSYVNHVAHMLYLYVQYYNFIVQWLIIVQLELDMVYQISYAKQNNKKKKCREK